MNLGSNLACVQWRPVTLGESFLLDFTGLCSGLSGGVDARRTAA
jgi:hypothetical protein